MSGIFLVFATTWYGLEADVFPFRFARVVGRLPNFWFAVETDVFSHGCSRMKTEGASFD